MTAVKETTESTDVPTPQRGHNAATPGERVLAIAIPLAAWVTSRGSVLPDRHSVESVLGSSSLVKDPPPGGGGQPAPVILRDAAGETLRGRSVTWTSSAPLVAAVDPITGKITGLADGIANIVATSENVSGTAQLSVYTPVASVSVTLATSALFIGRTIQASATPRDERDSVLPGRAVSWSSSDSVVAMVEATTGMVTAHAEGTATIRATSDGVIG